MGLGFGVQGWGFRSRRIRGSALLVALARLRPRLAGGGRPRRGAFLCIVNGVTMSATRRQKPARDGPLWVGRWLGMARFLAVCDR